MSTFDADPNDHGEGEKVKFFKNFWTAARELLEPFEKDPPEIRLKALDRVVFVAVVRAITAAVCSVGGPVGYVAAKHFFS